jgi:hypothetical protein
MFQNLILSHIKALDALDLLILFAVETSTIKDRERAWEPSTVVASTVAVVNRITK